MQRPLMSTLLTNSVEIFCSVAINTKIIMKKCVIYVDIRVVVDHIY